MNRLVSILVACSAAFCASFAISSVLQSCERPIYPPMTDRELAEPQPVGIGLFGWPVDPLEPRLVELSAVLGFGVALRVFTSRSDRWRFHVPFWLGWSLLVAALRLILSVIQKFMFIGALTSGYGFETLAFLYPAPLQAVMLMTMGLPLLLFSIAHEFPSLSGHWRFHVPFFLGLGLLCAALSVAIGAIHSTAVYPDNIALFDPGPLEVTLLTMAGITAVTFACVRDRHNSILGFQISVGNVFNHEPPPLHPRTANPPDVSARADQSDVGGG